MTVTKSGFLIIRVNLIASMLPFTIVTFITSNEGLAIILKVIFKSDNY